MAKSKSWVDYENLKCVILCAGVGNRLYSAYWNKPKVLAELNGKTILEHNINYWKQYTNDFVFVVCYLKEMVIDLLNQIAPQNFRYQAIEQDNPKGIGDAVSRVEAAVGDKFIVVLGDCLCNGSFIFLPNMEQGIGVLKTSNSNLIRQNYSVKEQNLLVTEVNEQPKRITNAVMCGLGYYFFNKAVFKYIKETPASNIRNEVEITDVIANMIMDGVAISPVILDGLYVNINTPEDFKRAELIVRSQQSNAI